jgi:hypothetical protein
MDKAEDPPSDAGIHWTKGIAFEVKGKPISTNPQSTPRAAFYRINGFTVGIYNRSELAGSDGSDKVDHAGGWAAISEYVSKSVGGKWTARSLVMVRGLFEKARAQIT